MIHQMTDDRRQWTVRYARRRRGSFAVVCVLFSLLCTACYPKFDWRVVQNDEAALGVGGQYQVLMPGKPSRLSRDIQLGTQSVKMHMTAVKIDGVSFAVGAVNMSDATQARLAIDHIKQGLLNNMGGAVLQDKTTAISADGKLILSDQFSATNPDSSIRMFGRLVSRDSWVFEVLVVGPASAINQEAVDTFLESFEAGS